MQETKDKQADVEDLKVSDKPCASFTRREHRTARHFCQIQNQAPVQVSSKPLRA